MNIDSESEPTNLYDYNEIKDKIKPYDLIAFRGGDLVSDFISYLEKKTIGVGFFTHVGMAVTSDILPSCIVDDHEFVLEEGKVYLLESTFTYSVLGVSDGIPDVTTDKCMIGVQLRDLEVVIPHYIVSDKTKVAWCPLKKKYRKKIQDGYLNQESGFFTELFHEYHNRYYEMDAIGLLGSMFPSMRGLRDERNKIYKKMYKILQRWHIVNPDNEGPAGWQFCSELVANIYLAIGVLNNIDPKDVLPVDFFGYDLDGIPALVDDPCYIRDWEIED
jgi:hypothetical protein